LIGIAVTPLPLGYFGQFLRDLTQWDIVFDGYMGQRLSVNLANREAETLARYIAIYTRDVAQLSISEVFVYPRGQCMADLFPF